jgi:putative ABC transport system permease protein
MPIRVLVSRFLGKFGRPRRERDLHDEVETHLQLLTDEHILSGLSPAHAQAAGRRAFGGVEQMKECYRDQRGWPWLEDLVRDTWYGARLLMRRPGFTTAAVFALALGIGANTVVFTIVNAILLRNLPFDHPSRSCRSARATRTAATSACRG